MGRTLGVGQEGKLYLRYAEHCEMHILCDTASSYVSYIISYRTCI